MPRFAHTVLQWAISQWTSYSTQAREKFVSLSVPIVVPVVTCVDTYPSEGNRKEKEMLCRGL
jgi:hypothetical protein